MRLDGTRLGLPAPANTTIKAGRSSTRAWQWWAIRASRSRDAATALGDKGDELLGSIYREGPLEHAGLHDLKAKGIAFDPAPAHPQPQPPAGSPGSGVPMPRPTSPISLASLTARGSRRLDVTNDAKFYAGNFVTADNNDLWMDIES